jgi:transcriptional repressor NrdR
LNCPYCNASDTKVIDSRPAEDNSIRRRRQCDRCGRRFTTYEKLETIPFMVIKKDNTRELYNRAKIEDGVLRSCHKRPVSPQQIEHLVNEVENEIMAREEREISTTFIGELVMSKLKSLDEVAYVRFASVYRQFKDVHTFMEELGKILESKTDEA